MTSIPLLVIGAGPAGLATAIAATQAGIGYVVLERAALVNSLLHFPRDMVFFTTPELLEIGALPFVSPNEKPTRSEALRYYRRAVDRFQLDIHYDEPVVSIERGGDGVFVVGSQPQHGVARRYRADTVVAATGAYDVVNRLDIPGEDLPHVSHYYTEPHPCFRRRVLVVGGKNSAAEAALDLFRSGAHVQLVHRNAKLGESIKYWVKPDIENRIAEGSIPARFQTRVVEIKPAEVVLEGPDGRDTVPADFVFLLTGYRGDTAMLRRAGVEINEEHDAPVFNPETFETNVPNLFVAGSVVAGRQSGRVFIENGRFHGESVVRAVVDKSTARR